MNKPKNFCESKKDTKKRLKLEIKSKLDGLIQGNGFRIIDLTDKNGKPKRLTNEELRKILTE